MSLRMVQLRYMIQFEYNGSIQRDDCVAIINSMLDIELMTKYGSVGFLEIDFFAHLTQLILMMIFTVDDSMFTHEIVFTKHGSVRMIESSFYQ